MAQYSAQILKTLSDQIKNLSPLRESFKHLQTYYSKLTHEFNDLITYGERSEAELLSKLRYLEEIHRELEHEFSECGEQLRNAQCEQAKLLMQRNQQIAQGQALKSRQQLQLGQKAAFENKRRDLLQHSSKLQFNIGKYKELIHNLELTIKSKQYENIDIQREIKKMELINSKITQLNKQTEQNIDSTQDENQKIIEQLRQLEDKLNSYSKLIQAKEKLNKQSVQTLITKTQELQQLRHRKDYIEKLIQTEASTQRQLIRNHGEVESILNMKRQKLQLVCQENHQYQVAIAEEKAKEQNNKDELEKLTIYLKTLVQTNGILFNQLERSCAEDRQVQVMLSQKLEKLMLVNDKITENQMLTKFDMNLLHQQQKLTKNTHSSSSSALKKEQKAKYSPSLPSPSAKGNIAFQIEERLSRERQRQMASTWGSLTKQNYRFDL